MIDNQEITKALIEEMKAMLPIPVQPTKRLVNQLREQPQNLDVKIKSNTKMEIQDIVYLGDEGGIACECVTTPVKNKNPMFFSITHLDIPKNHPLYKKIKAYQLNRIKKLAQQNLR